MVYVVLKWQTINNYAIGNRLFNAYCSSYSPAKISTMADWSHLPPELLTQIAKHLKTRFDVVRFRSVCSSWRSSCSPKLYPLAKCLPLITRGRYEYSLGRITRNTLFLVRLPGAENHNNQAASACWLFKTREGTHWVKMQLLNPLSDSKLKPLPLNFPKVLDLTNFQIIELGHQFVCLHEVHIDHPLEPEFRDYKEKVAFLWSSTDGHDFMLLALFGFARFLGFLRSGENEWTLIENVHGVVDIISFNGKFYGIEREGRTIVVDQSLNVSFLEHVGSRSSRKFLVQSGDNLLAVEMLFRTSSGSDVQRLEYCSRSSCKMIGFRIFRLDEEEQKWDEMDSLGHQILFLGLRQAISASASDFYLCKGNLIFYSTGLSILPCYDDSKDRLMSVFDLDTGTASPCPAYCNFLRPPPEWLTSPESVISSREFISNSSYSVISATAEIELDFTREVQGKSPERVTYAGQEAATPSSKCSFKFCCF